MTADQGTLPPYRYYLTEGDNPEHEVAKAQYVSAERGAGFINTLGQRDEPATASFSTDAGGGLRGRTEYDYPKANSGPLCGAEESGYLDSTDVFCPFLPGPDYTCTGGCPTNRERICITGEE